MGSRSVSQLAWLLPGLAGAVVSLDDLSTPATINKELAGSLEVLLTFQFGES